MYGVVVSRVPSSATFQYSVSALAPLDCLYEEQENVIVVLYAVTCHVTWLLCNDCIIVWAIDGTQDCTSCQADLPAAETLAPCTHIHVPRSG